MKTTISLYKLVMLCLVVGVCLVGCSQPDKNNVVEADETKEVEKQTTPAPTEADEEKEEEGTDASTYAEGVHSLPLDFRSLRVDLDPDHILTRDKQEVGKQLESEGLQLLDYPASTTLTTSFTGNETLKQVNVLEQIAFSLDGGGDRSYEVIRYNLYHATEKAGGDVTPLVKTAFTLDIKQEKGIENAEVTIEGPLPIPTELDSLRLHHIVLDQGTLYFEYQDKDTVLNATQGSTTTTVYKTPIQQDGSLGETTKVMNKKIIDFHLSGIVQTNQDPVGYQYSRVVAKFDDKPNFYLTNELPSAKTPLYLNQDTNIALFKNEQTEEVVLYNIQNDDPVKGNHQLNDMGYTDWGFAGYDPKTGYLYILGQVDNGYGVQSSIHVLDSSFNEVADIAQVNTSTLRTSPTEDGFILWSEEEVDDVLYDTASKVTFIDLQTH